MIRFSSIICFFLCAGFLAACETPMHFSNREPQLVAEPDKVSAMLADAATQASNALEQLAAVESSRSPNISVNPIGDAPTPLRRAVTVSWVGPVEPITQKLAERASYNFEVLGTPPTVPVVVSLDIENRPVIEVLRDIGLQLGMRGDVRVDESRSVVEIHYPPTEGAEGMLSGGPS